MRIGAHDLLPLGQLESISSHLRHRGFLVKFQASCPSKGFFIISFLSYSHYGQPPTFTASSWHRSLSPCTRHLSCGHCAEAGQRIPSALDRAGLLWSGLWQEGRGLYCCDSAFQAARQGRRAGSPSDRAGAPYPLPRVHIRSDSESTKVSSRPMNMSPASRQTSPSCTSSSPPLP
jgi:hypothetical protein